MNTPIDPVRDYKVLDFGVFIIASSDPRRSVHGIRVSYVPRVGKTVHEPLYRWDTASCPASLVQTVTLRYEAFFADAILHHYGIQQDLPF